MNASLPHLSSVSYIQAPYLHVSTPNINRLSSPMIPVVFSPPTIRYPTLNTSIMTGRHPNSPAPSIKSEPLQNEFRQLKINDSFLSPESMKPLKRSSTAKLSRPTMEFYTPRNATTRNGNKVHFEDEVKRASPPPSQAKLTELKSALKRSKSFTADDRDSSFGGLGKDSFPSEYHGLLRQAVSDPNVLSCQQLMELVRMISIKAIEDSSHSEKAARLCFSIIEKEHDHTFLESLQNCCREWYSQRDRLLLQTAPPSPNAPPPQRRWPAYVCFLIELYLQVKGGASPPSKGMPTPHPNSPMAHFALELQTLLFECAELMLKRPFLNNRTEVEIFRSMMRKVGMQMESDSQPKMDRLMNSLRDAFLTPFIGDEIRKSLLEVIELNSSGWVLDKSQMRYYYAWVTSMGLN